MHLKCPYPDRKLGARLAGITAVLAVAITVILAACRAPALPPTPQAIPERQPEPGPPALPLPAPELINLDAETQALIASAPRTVFLIPFSHWDTDWHRSYSVYANMADRNIAAAIRMAKADPRFR